MNRQQNTRMSYEPFLSRCKKAIIDQKISCYNYSKSKGVSLCFNFLEVEVNKRPEILLTATVLFNGQKAYPLDGSPFGTLCGMVESELRNFSRLSGITEKVEGIPYFESIDPYVKYDGWYSVLKCHRLFIIPEADYEYLTMVLKRKDFTQGLLDLNLTYNKEYFKKIVKAALRTQEKEQESGKTKLTPIPESPITTLQGISCYLFTSQHSSKIMDIGLKIHK